MRRMWKNSVRALLVVLIAVNTAFYSGCVSASRISGSSMYPSLHNGDVWLLAHGTEINRHDIISIYRPEEGRLVKRVIALPGESVLVAFGTVYIDGEILREPMIVLRKSKAVGKWDLGPDEFFVLGDNRPDSHDSVDFGPVKRDEIRGELVFRLWRRR